MKLVENRSSKRNAPLSKEEATIVGTGAAAIVREFLPAFPIYAATPLESLPGLAAEVMGIGPSGVADRPNIDKSNF
ncbi:hypothetical protein ASD50_17285 [Mesorhizobium sp. Root552]|uniref:hypothetical protein n=1 Tax=Mesorhizobium sp. Root552 TaxID=1736555 RepID=UPI0006F36A18|nr:hypothetical protein [Mesorhizobium sp. Root552]KQZ30768.1 hypothetical protein ASD50_17285 [Mesorhizobium sp. Root552]